MPEATKEAAARRLPVYAKLMNDASLLAELTARCT